MPPRSTSTVAFDHHDPKYADGHHEMLKSIRDTCPVAWTEAHGGYWVATGHDAVLQIARDDMHFTQTRDHGPPPLSRIAIPPPPTTGAPLYPLESAPRDVALIRRAIMPWFSSRAALERESHMEEIVEACLDAVIDRGQIDLVNDFAGPSALRFIDDLLAMPPRRYVPIDPAEYQGARFQNADLLAVLADLPSELARRRNRSGAEDLFSFLAGLKFGDDAVDDELVLGIVRSVIVGGSDTTTALVVNACGWLDAHPLERRLLADEPQRLDAAVEEFLRCFPPILSFPRTAVADIQVGDQLLGQGDRVLMSWAAANRDPHVFEAPDEVRLGRVPNPHTSFGAGIHRCIGMHYARMQARVMIGSLLRRIPDYRVDWSKVSRFRDLSSSDGYKSMPATFAAQRWS